MSFLLRHFGELWPFPEEKKVDCDRCQVHSPLARYKSYDPKVKCCDFKPFWNAFFVGEWLCEGHTLEAYEKDMEFLPVGVLHPEKERKDWSTYRNSPSIYKEIPLCRHFNKETTQCEIWQYRPLLCRSFFCTSEFAQGLSFYENFESLFQEMVSELLKKFYLENGGSEVLWDSIVDYLDEDFIPLEKDSPLFLGRGEAEEFYKRAFQWLKGGGLKNNLDDSWDERIQNLVEQKEALC